MNNLRTVRTEKGWSQEKLAAEARMTQPTISRIEKGNDFYFSVGVRLARALDVPLDRLAADDAPAAPARD